jgi:hypothetical protein
LRFLLAIHPRDLGLHAPLVLQCTSIGYLLAPRTGQEDHAIGYLSFQLVVAI